MLLPNEYQISSCEHFPFIQTQNQRPVVIEPIINFEIRNVRQIVQLIKQDYIQFVQDFDRGMVFNLNIKPDNVEEVSKLFQHIASCAEFSTGFTLKNVTCDTKCTIFSDLVRQCDRLTAFTMINVRIHSCDIKDVMEHLCSRRNLLSLSLNGVLLSESQCVTETNYFPNCLLKVSCLQELSIVNTKLTEEQTMEVVKLLPSFQLRSLDLLTLPLASVVSQFKQVLPTLVLLKWLSLLKLD